MKTVRLVVTDDEYKEHTFLLTFNEFGAMIGSLNLTIVISSCEGIGFLGGPETLVIEGAKILNHLKELFDGEDLIVLSQRLHAFAFDAGWID